MKKIYSSFLTLLMALSLHAQTALVPGDIAFVGFQSGQSGQTALDRFAFLLLKDVSSGTRIRFSDKGVLTQNPLKFCPNEGWCTWTAPTSGLPAGTVVTIGEDSSSTIGTVKSSLSFAQTGDQIIALDLNDADTNVVSGFSSNTWLTACFGLPPCSTNVSCLPAPLLNGVNAVGFPSLRKNAFFNLATQSGSREDLLAVINNPANWDRSDNLQTWPTWSFTIVTSLEEAKTLKALKIYPSSSQGIFTIENTGQQEKEIWISNLGGQVLHHQKINQGKTTLQLNYLASGLYLAKTSDGAVEKIRIEK